MARRKKKNKPLPTIWEVNDELWNRSSESILDELDPPAKTGRPRTDEQCEALNGIIYQMRSGVPVEPVCRRSISATTAVFTAPCSVGSARACSSVIWAVLIENCEDLGGRRLAVAERRWRHGQGAFWGDLVGPNPTDRGKPGTKRSVIVEADGGPLGVVVGRSQRA